MKRHALLGAGAVLACATAPGFAQVSVPLPKQAGGQSGSVTVPLPPPSVTVPLPPPRPAEPQPDANRSASVPAVPIGAYGRPDINPYDRDIDMTVPLTFRSTSLGDIPLRLTADDRFFLDSATFMRLMRPILNDPAQSDVATALKNVKSFDPATLSGTGVELTYDPTSLSVVVVNVSPDKRAVQQLFAAPADDLNDVDLSPAGFSGYVNLNLLDTRIWEQHRTEKPTFLFDGALRFGRVVFEGDAQVGEQFTLTGGEEYGFSRNYARLVYDQAEDYRRWYAGDLDPETRGQQSFVRMGGVGVVRQRRRFNAFRAAILQSDRQLVIQRESTVRFIRNGVLYRQVLCSRGATTSAHFRCSPEATTSRSR